MENFTSVASDFPVMFFLLFVGVGLMAVAAWVYFLVELSHKKSEKMKSERYRNESRWVRVSILGFAVFFTTVSIGLGVQFHHEANILTWEVSGTVSEVLETDGNHMVKLEDNKGGWFTVSDDTLEVGSTVKMTCVETRNKTSSYDCESI